MLLDLPPEAFKSEEVNTAHLSPATTPPREQCDMEHSTQKLVAQIEYSAAELSTSKDIIGSSREHLETGVKDEDNLVSITQQSPVLTSPFLQFKWAKQPFTSGPPKLVNMSSSQSSRQGRPSPSDEPRTASYASVTSVSLSLEESKWAINKLAGQRGAVKPTNQGRAISSSSKGKASSGLSFAGEDSGGHIQEKRRHATATRTSWRFQSIATHLQTSSGSSPPSAGYVPPPSPTTTLQPKFLRRKQPTTVARARPARGTQTRIGATALQTMEGLSRPSPPLLLLSDQLHLLRNRRQTCKSRELQTAEAWGK